jgi:hypothetical protein
MKSASLTLVFVVTCAFSLVPTTALADDEPPPPLPGAGATSSTQEPVTLQPIPPAASNADRRAEGPPRYDLIRVNAGIKMGYVTNSAYDTFGKNDVLTQVSVDGTYPLLHTGRLVLGAGLGWDGGGRSGTLRGNATDLTIHRLSVPIEGRFHFAPSVYGFGKVAPGAAAVIASVTEGSSAKTLETTGWAFSADASVGASILMGPRQNLDKRTVRFWLTPEFGYSYTTNAPIRPNPGREDKDLLGSDENTSLRALALSGIFWRATIGATF